MRRSWLLAALVAVAAPLTTALAEGKEGTASGKAEAEVRAFLDEMNAAFAKKDVAWFTAHTAHDADMVNYGTDAAEHWVGWNAYKQAMDAQFSALGAIKGTLREVHVKVHRTGDLAWVAYLCDFIGTSGGEPFDVKGMRVSAVLERRKGTWLFVSSHSSMGVQGQVVKY